MDETLLWEEVAPQVQLVKMLSVAGGALLFYDYFLTINQEATWIWPTKPSPLKAAILLTRYLPFFDITFSTFCAFFISSHSNSLCRTSFIVTAVSFIIGMMSAEVIMTTWTWSVWSCNRSIGITLSLLFAGTLTGLAILLHQFLSSIITIHPPNELPNGCYVSAGNNHLAIIIVLIMLYNGVTFAFMLAKCSTVLKFRRGHRAIFKRSLVNIVFINGTFYYAMLFSLSIANVVVMKTLPPVMGDLLTAVQRVMHPILSLRMVMDLRNRAAADSKNPHTLGDVPLETLKFA